MFRASNLLFCATLMVAGVAAAQTANKQVDGFTTAISSGTMAVEGSESAGSDDPTVTLGDGTTTDDTIGSSDTADAGNSLMDGSGGDDALPDGPFSRLSPGNQKIVRALFDAQSVPTTGDTGTTMSLSGSADNSHWTLDQIAQAKQHTGFGKLFKEMQDAGVIPDDVKNLGQLVSGKYQPSDVAPEPATMTDGQAGTAASADRTVSTGTVTQGVDASAQTAVSKAKVTTATTARASGKALKANRGGGKHPDLVITTGNGRQVHIGAASKSKAKTVGAAATKGKGGKHHSTAGRSGGAYSATTVVTTGSGAQAAMGAGRALGHAKGVNTGAGRSAAGGRHGKGVHTGKGSSKVTITSGRGGAKGLTHRSRGKAKGKFK